MNTAPTVDKAGRVVLPTPVRDELQLSAGDSLDLESSGDRIVLRPVRGTARMRKRRAFGSFVQVNPSLPSPSMKPFNNCARSVPGWRFSPKRSNPKAREAGLRYFFDTTVLVAGVLEEHEHHEPSFSMLSTASRTSAFCAAHKVAEVYATLTRYPGKQRLSVEQALLALTAIESRFTIVALETREYLAAIRRFATIGITGGTI